MMRVLIVKTSALGDVIHALPVIDYLQQVVPDVEIDWVVEDRCRQILAGHPGISHLHVIHTRKWKKHPFSRETWREIREFRDILRHRNYDLVFDIQGNLKSGFLSWFSGAGDRIGFTGDALQESANLFFTTRQVSLRKHDYHVTDRSLRLASVPFGKDYRDFTLSSFIPISSEHAATATVLLSTLSDGLVFLFQHGTTWSTKLWHDEGWIELGRRLHAEYPNSAILINWGSDEEKKRAEKIALSVGGVIRPLPWLTIGELAALIGKVDLVIGGDSGPVHIAAALGTPTVSLYRATDPRRNGPRGGHHVIIQSPLHCRVCLRKECDRDRQCRESITVEAVLKGVETALEL
jgi:heptosyltransferase-1